MPGNVNPYHNPKLCGTLFSFYQNENGRSEILNNTPESLKVYSRKFSYYLLWIIIYGLNHNLVNCSSNTEKRYHEQGGYL